MHSRSVGILAGVPLVVGGLVGAAPAPAGAAAAVAGGTGASSHITAYVTDSHGGTGTLTPIDTVTGHVGTPITLGGFPVAVALTPKGSFAWVVRRPTSGPGNVVSVKLSTRRVGKPITVGAGPVAIAITPNGKAAYVANSDGNSVTPINLATGSAGNPIPVGPTPTDIAITPNGKTAWVTDENADCADNTCDPFLTPIKLSTDKAGPSIDLGSDLVSTDAIAVTPNGKEAYIASLASGGGLGPSVANPVDLATRTVGASVQVNLTPDAVAITPDGRTALTSNLVGGSVTAISVATNQAANDIPVGPSPAGLAVTPDGKTAYVTNSNAQVKPPVGSVTPIDLANESAGTAIPVGEQPNSVAITPDQAPVASFTATPGAAGTATQFDASASTVRYGTIKQYAWSFGDGQSLTTNTPKIAHTYAAAGSYTVALTETDSAGTSTKVVFTGKTVSRNGGPSARVSHSITVPG